MGKLTREDLRNMAMGETKTFRVANAQACDSGKATTYQMRNILQCRFEVQTDYATNTLTITKNPL